MKRFILLSFFLILNIAQAQITVERVNCMTCPTGNVYSIDYNGSDYVAGTDNGVYSSVDASNWQQKSYGDKIITMVEYLDGRCFAGVAGVNSLGFEVCSLMVSDNLVDWYDTYDTEFGDFSLCYIQDIHKHDNQYFLALSGNSSDPGGYLYAYDLSNSSWEEIIEGFIIIQLFPLSTKALFDFYTVETYKNNLFITAKPYPENIEDNYTDGSVMRFEGTEYGILSSNYEIFCSTVKDGYYFAGGKDSLGNCRVYRTSSAFPDKYGDQHINGDWTEFFPTNEKCIVTAMESGLNYIIVGTDNGKLFYSLDNASTWSEIVISSSVASINDIYFDSYNKNQFIVGTDNGMYRLIVGTAPSTFSLSGTITDCSTDDRLNDVTVKLFKDGTNISETTSKLIGKYNFSDLEAGSYTLEFSYTDYTFENPYEVEIVDSDVVLDVCGVDTTTPPDTFIVSINVKCSEYCDPAPAIEGATVTIYNNVYDYVQYTNADGDVEFLFNNEISSASLLIEHPDYEDILVYDETLDITDNMNLNVSMIPLDNPTNISIVPITTESEYLINDTVSISVTYEQRCNFDVEPPEIWVEYDPAELYLLSHSFSAVDGSDFYKSQTLTNNAQLDFLVLLGGAPSTTIYYYFNDSSLYTELTVSTEQPFFIIPSSEYGEIKSVSPNPAMNRINIALDIYIADKYQLYLVDSEGNTVDDICNRNLNDGVWNIQHSLDLAAGVYYVVLKSNNSLFHYPIIINK